jgi:hypothetical protein
LPKHFQFIPAYYKDKETDILSLRNIRKRKPGELVHSAVKLGNMKDSVHLGNLHLSEKIILKS